MHRVHCEVALLKLLRQKMRRKTKTCYISSVRNIRNALVRHKSADQCSRNQTHLEKKILPIFIITFEGERIYILQCQDRKTTTFVGITKFQIISSGRRHHGLFSKT